MAERPREIGDFKELVHFEGKFWVEGLRFAPLSMDRSMREWLYTTLPLKVFTNKTL